MVACWARMHKFLDCYPSTIKEGDLQKPKECSPPHPTPISWGSGGAAKTSLGLAPLHFLRGCLPWGGHKLHFQDKTTESSSSFHGIKQPGQWPRRLMEVHAKKQKKKVRDGDLGSLGVSIFAGEAWTKRVEVT